YVMKRFLQYPLVKWFLWFWLCLVIWGAFEYAPLAAGFLGESSRILFFHVPMAWTAFVAFFAAGIWSARYLFGGRQLRHDIAAGSAVELGLVFCVLATVTGSLWAKIMWGAYWNWDPRQVWITVAILFYGAYMTLRSAVPDPERQRRLAAAYGVLGLVVAPFLFFILPRMTGYTLHPEPVVNQTGKIEMERRMAEVLLLGSFGFMVLFFWMHNLRCRLAVLQAAREARELDLPPAGGTV
ncbi:MAG: cytochrome c biogenesis protein CcsA, partial [Acidobacteria bacterium]|nr:cytochrome c biogenesis protein CcsA [Acidobacteriota bacterium]